MGAITIMNDVIKVFIGLLFSEAIKQIRIGAILGVLTCGVRIANRTACPVSIPLYNDRSIPLCVKNDCVKCGKYLWRKASSLNHRFISRDLRYICFELVHGAIACLDQL